jgi:hypothetical protein
MHERIAPLPPPSRAELRSRRRQRLLSLAVVAALPVLAAACAKPPEPPPYKAVAGNRLLMLSVIDPAADVLWESVQTVMTLEGTEEIRPETDEQWDAVRNAAVVLAESGNLLMMDRRAMDQGDWIDWSAALTDAGEVAMQAVDSRDPQAVFDAGGQVYVTCAGCHEKYIVDTAASAPAPAQASQ